jgi:outer membrane protein W
MFKGQSIRILAASVIASALVGSAIADMVYDDENTMSAAPTKVEVKNVINNTGNPAAIASTEVVSTPPVIVETQKIQKFSEKSKEKRGFQESVNNELVVQKLEDKRLKQEEKLTNEINKKFTLEDEAPAGTPAPAMKEEIVVKPITEAPGSASNEMSVAPKGEVVVVKPIAQTQGDQIVNYQSSTSMSVAPTGKPDGEKTSKNGVSIIPRAGLSTISSSGYNISPKFMTGVGIGMDVTDNVAIEFGYSYSENGVRTNSPSPFGGYQATNELNFKNNTFDLALKLYLTGQDSKLRPYIGGGGAYSVGYINYDQQQQTYPYYTPPSSDYTLKQFQAMAQAGIDFKIASNISIGVAYKFYKPLTSSESDDGLYNGYFYNAYNYSPTIRDQEAQKQALRGTIRDSNINTFQVSAVVTF